MIKILQAAVRANLVNLRYNVIKSWSFSWINRPAQVLQLLKSRWGSFVSLPGDGFGFDLSEDRVVVELVERQFAMVEHLPQEARVRVDVALGRVLVLVHHLVG